MSTANNLSTMNGLFKKVYDGKLENLIPDEFLLQQLFKFIQKDKRPGEDYNQAVIVAQEHGVTYAGEEDGAFFLNSPISGQIKRASIKGFQMALRSAIAYDAAFAADSKGERAFEEASKVIVMNMLKSMQQKLEIRLFYGQSGLGEVASVSSNTITITTAEWAPGIWSGSENMRLEIRSSAGVLRGDCKVSSVDHANRTVTVDAMPAGVVATDVIYEYSSYGKEFAGLHKIISNTGSLFGIDASQYSLWKGNSYAVGGNLTFEKLAQGLARPVEKGLNRPVTVIVNPRTWSKLMTEQAGSRRYDVSFKKKAENGFDGLEFYSQNGKMTVRACAFVKEGYAYAVCEEDFKRIGSTDITFKDPMGGDIIHLLENNMGYGLRAYSNQALYCNKIGQQLLLTGITN